MESQCVCETHGWRRCCSLLYDMLSCAAAEPFSFRIVVVCMRFDKMIRLPVEAAQRMS